MGSSSAMQSFFLLWIVIGVVGFIATILFPMWAARYASTRGRSDLMLITIVSIFFGVGFFVGLVVWLAVRHTPVISLARSSPLDYSSDSDRSDDTSSAYGDPMPYRGPFDTPGWVEKLERMHDEEKERERDEEERKAREADDY